MRNLVLQIKASVLLIFIPFIHVAAQAPDAAVEKGAFVYSEYKPLANQPVKVWYFVPKGVHKDSQIVFVIHGNGRNAEGYRDGMIASAKKHQFIVVVPEFSKKYYPKVRDYHHGGIFDADDMIKPREQWTFSILEPLFDAVKNRFNNRSEKYYLYGFSAGSQFVHRFMYMMPDNSASKVVAASAGTYTMPDYDIEYSYGMKNVNIPDETLTKFYSKDFIVAVGAADTVLARKDLAKNTLVNKQGRDRVERAHNFFKQSKSLAQEKNMPFNWGFVEIPHVGHSQADIAQSIAELLFKE